MEMWQIEYRLLHSAPEFVYEWLESNLRENFVPIEDKRDRLEKRLLKRDDPLINLGLAMYGECPDIGYRMDYPNYFRARESELFSSHPEWFEDQ